MSFTTTTNFSLRKPIVGDSSDAWGDALNFTIDLVDTSLQSLTNAVALKADSWKNRIREIIQNNSELKKWIVYEAASGLGKFG